MTLQPSVVSDSPPLIHLARIGRLDLVPGIFERVVIPDAVWNEVTQTSRTSPGAREVAEAKWIERATADPVRVRPLRLLLLGWGEAEAIAVALAQSNLALLTDDKRARQTAKQFSIPIFGTLGVLGQAKRRGLISAVRPLTARLQATDWRISEGVLEDFLRGLGE